MIKLQLFPLAAQEKLEGLNISIRGSSVRPWFHRGIPQLSVVDSQGLAHLYFSGADLGTSLMAAPLAFWSNSPWTQLTCHVFWEVLPTIPSTPWFLLKNITSNNKLSDNPGSWVACIPSCVFLSQVNIKTFLSALSLGHKERHLSMYANAST